ncbi:MAG: right-handed parallel beta-helix repeat-containing protein, partial [Planctomycetota bacterium]
MSGGDFYVSPTGGADGKGTMGSPWDLRTAFSHPSSVRPGDTIWLRGGTYGSGGATVFRCKLNGTKSKPIYVRQYPGERATVDGGISAGRTSSWVVFWGFEITNSSTVRSCKERERPTGLDLLGRGHKAINLIIHDTGHPGIGFWRQVGDGGEIHGCLIWACGLYDTTRGRWTRGSGIYAQNETGTRYFTDTFVFRNFTNGINGYTRGSRIDGFHLEGNVCFDCEYDAILIRPVHKPCKRLKLISNYTWARERDKQTGQVQLGHYGDPAHEDAEVRDNYFHTTAHFHGTLHAYKFKDIICTGNTFIGRTNLIELIEHPAPGKIKWDKNTYHGGDDQPFRVFGDSQYTLGGWRSRTGFDLKSTHTPSWPTGVKVFVRKNKYEDGRGHIVIYNWAKRPSVDVDVSGVLT